jgi:hypothetical protein
VKCFITRFEKNTLLRIHGAGLRGRYTECGVVKELGITEKRAIERRLTNISVPPNSRRGGESVATRHGKTRYVSKSLHATW